VPLGGRVVVVEVEVVEVLDVVVEIEKVVVDSTASEIVSVGTSAELASMSMNAALPETSTATTAAKTLRGEDTGGVRVKEESG
jgi:predicted HTH domain antitoxin